MRGRDFDDDDEIDEERDVIDDEEQLDEEEPEFSEESNEGDFATSSDDEDQYESDDNGGADDRGYSDFNTEYAQPGSMERRLTPSQAEMVYLLDADDVPEHLRPHVWAIVSRHLELIDIPDYRRLIAFKPIIRDILRTSTWKRGMDKVSYSDMIQIEFYAFLLLSKSLNRGERTLLATNIQRTQVEDFGERTPLNQSAYNSGGLRGLLNNMFR